MRTTGREASFLFVGNTHFLELILNHESMQQFLGETNIGPGIEVRIVKILEEYGLEISIPSIVNPCETSYVVISRETERLWMTSMTTERSSDPVTNSSQPFRNQKGKDFVWNKKDPIASSKLVLLKATRKFVQTLSAILLVILSAERLSFLQVKGNGLLLTPTLHEEDICLQVSKVVTKMIRHHDQDEREQDGSDHLGTVRSVLLKAIAQKGAG